MVDRMCRLARMGNRGGATADRRTGAASPDAADVTRHAGRSSRTGRRNGGGSNETGSNDGARRFPGTGRHGHDKAMDVAGVSGLCAGEQHPAAAEPQRLPLGGGGHEGGQGGPAAVAHGLDDAGLHELPVVERLRQRLLHGDLRRQRRSGALSGRDAPHDGPPAAVAEPHRRADGRGGRERHPPGPGRGLHAGALRLRGGGDRRQHGRSITRPARPGPRDVADGVDQQGRLRPDRKPVRERRIPGRRGPHDTRQLQIAAQAAARTRHNGRDGTCRTRRR